MSCAAAVLSYCMIVGRRPLPKPRQRIKQHIRALLRRAAAGASGGGGGGAVGVAELAVLAKMLRWPPPALFPALDLARLLALAAVPAAQLAADAGPIEPSSAGRAMLCALASVTAVCCRVMPGAAQRAN